MTEVLIYPDPPCSESREALALLPQRGVQPCLEQRPIVVCGERVIGVRPAQCALDVV